MNLEILGNGCRFAILGDGECELLVERQPNGLRSVCGLVDFETDVKVLAGKEVGPVAIV